MKNSLILYENTVVSDFSVRMVKIQNFLGKNLIISQVFLFFFLCASWELVDGK